MPDEINVDIQSKELQDQMLSLQGKLSKLEAILTIVGACFVLTVLLGSIWINGQKQSLDAFDRSIVAQSQRMDALQKLSELNEDSVSWKLRMLAAESRKNASDAALYSRFGSSEWLLKRAKDHGQEWVDEISRQSN